MRVSEWVNKCNIYISHALHEQIKLSRDINKDISWPDMYSCIISSTNSIVVVVFIIWPF